MRIDYRQRDPSSDSERRLARSFAMKYKTMNHIGCSLRKGLDIKVNDTILLSCPSNLSHRTPHTRRHKANLSALIAAVKDFDAEI